MIGCAVSLALATLAAGSMLADDAAAVPVPVVITDVCASTSKGQLSVPLAGGGCPSTKTLHAVDDPNAVLQTCYLISNGAIRKVSSATQCVSAPRSKKETALLVPSLTTDLYFCANNSDGALFFKGTSAVTCKSGQYLVVIEQANTPPVSAAGTLTTLEDTPGSATLSATDEDGNAITFAIASQGTKGTAAPVGSPSCNGLTPSTCTIQADYTPAANENGTDAFTFTASDALATSAPATVAVTITPVNDAPSFAPGLDQFANEDAGAQSVTGWASAISAGPANESAQAVNFLVVGNTNPALFAVQPAVSPSGDLTYTPAPDANGVASLTLVLTDDGGTANGGADTSTPHLLQITVTPVNDAPSFAKGGDELVLEDADLQTISPWATVITAGPPDESGQNISFTVTDNTNPGLFVVAPAVAPDGTLTYRAADDANGSATITLVASDDGSPSASSGPQSFLITVQPVNDAPSFDPLAGDPAPVNEDSFAVTVPGFATGMTAGPANETGQALTFVFVSNDNPSLFDGLGGQPLLDAATGTLTYTPAPNAYGTAVITIKLMDDGGTAAGGDDDSDLQTFQIVVTPVNDAPSFALPASPDQTVLEDAVAQTVPGFATAISPGANEAGQVLTFNVTNGNNALFSAQPDINETTGDLTYTPAPNANGTTTVSVSLSDDAGATSGAQSFQLTVTPVNDEPSFTVGANQSVAQDAGAQIVPAFATSISAGPTDESSQTLTFHASTDNDALFATLPAIDASGELTYEPATGATGSATVTVHLTDDGGTANGGDDTSATQTFQIAVAPPNATPVAVFQTGVNAVVTNEDTPTTITLTATDADDDDLTFSVVDSPSHGTLAATGTPDCTTTANTCSATFDYTPDADYAGFDIFTFKANDGLADSSPGTVDVVMLAINDAPSFTKGADETVLEDAGAQTVNGWATAISPGGGADETGQAVTFNVTGNTNAALFSVAPAVSSDGHLTYTPAANEFGSATITIEAQDDLGATSAAETFVVNVTAVNDAPSFTAGANQTVAEDAAAQSVPGWATAISKGPANESGQTLVFAVTGNTDAGLFAVAPAVSPTGTLTYTVAPNQHGTATITLKLSDDGGTANGGVAETATQQFDITVTAVNDAPTSPGRAYGASSLQANMQRSIDAAGGLLVGVADAADVAGNGSYTPSITLGTVNGATPASGTITTTIAGTGTVVANAATGAFTINPAPGVTGNVSFTYTVCDTGEGAPASACSAPATASFDIAGPVIWFVNPAAGVNGNGTLTSPFNTLASADAVDAANQRVFVYSGTTTTGLALNTGEWLIGQPASGGPFDTFFSIAPPAGTTARPTMGSGTTTIGGTVSVATDARVQGIALATAAAAGLTGTGPITGVSVSETSVATTTGTAVNLNDAAGSYTLSSVSTNGAANGILLTALGASNVTVNGGTILAAGTRGIDISGGTGDFTYTGSITTSSGRSVEVTGHTGGTVALSGSIADTGLGINLDANTGATLNFSGGLTVSTGTNAAFKATAGGTVNVTGSNTLATTTGTALTVTDTTIGASDLTFQSIAANGAVNGIVLSNTGSSGGLTVGGGTIQNTTGNGISLTSTRDVSLSSMSILNADGSGINGTGVTNFSFVNGTISDSGDAGFESNIAFDGGGTNLGNNLAGTLTITGSTLTNAYHSGLNLQSDNGTVTDAVITGNTITSTTSTATSKGTGINIVGVGSASTVFNLTKATIDNNVITNFPSGAGIQVNLGNTNAGGPGSTAGTPGSATDVVTITNNRVQGASAANRMGTHAILVSNNGGNPGSRGRMNVNVSNNGTAANPLTNITGIVIGVGNNGSATMTGTFANNRVVANNTLASGGISGGNGVVTATGTETPDLTLTVTGNSISQTDGNGILLVGRGTSGIARLKIQNNAVGAPLSGVRPGIRIDAGNNTVGTDDSICLNISGNTSAGSGGSQGIGLRKQGTVSTTHDFAINGMAATATPGVEAYVNSLNPAGGGTLLISATSGFSSCTLP